MSVGLAGSTRERICLSIKSGVDMSVGLAGSTGERNPNIAVKGANAFVCMFVLAVRWEGLGGVD
jgi:hypothetical protein